MPGTTSDVVRTVCTSGHISETVVTAVAEAKGVDPLDLEPLYSAVDPDALNSLFCSSTVSPPASLKVSFSMAGCDVVVREDGEVAVTPLAVAGERSTPMATTED